MKIEMDSENGNQLKRIRKSPLLLSQEESLTEKGKIYPCLFDKNQKTYEGNRRFPKTFSLSETFAQFSRFDYFLFEVLKSKTTSCRTLRSLS